MAPHSLAPILLFAVSLVAGCSSSGRTQLPGSTVEVDRDSAVGEKRGSRKSLTPPAPWGDATLHLSAIEGDARTITFHIGSPLLLRLSGARDLACEPFDGRPFFFDEVGAQVGWGLVEVSDSLLLPRSDDGCDRFLMLTSENSNRLPEGSFTLKTLVFVDEKRSVYSDTIVLRAKRSETGADSLSFNRFLIEQILRNSPLLGDPETLRAVFGPGTPRSAETEVYRALILQRAGDAIGFQQSLDEVDRLVRERGAPLDANAARVIDRLRTHRTQSP